MVNNLSHNADRFRALGRQARRIGKAAPAQPADQSAQCYPEQQVCKATSGIARIVPAATPEVAAATAKGTPVAPQSSARRSNVRRRHQAAPPCGQRSPAPGLALARGQIVSEQQGKKHQHEGGIEAAGQCRFRVEGIAIVDLRFETSRISSAANASGDGTSRDGWKASSRWSQARSCRPAAVKTPAIALWSCFPPESASRYCAFSTALKCS